MNRNEDIPVEIADCLCACAEQAREIPPDSVAPVSFVQRDTAHAGRGLIADLHHCYIRTGSLQLFECFSGKAADRIRLLADRVVLPGLGCALLSGRPTCAGS